MSQRVAIIGAGPSGIVAAKFLQQEGLQTTLFEQSDQAGGQWHVSNSLSGIWPGMLTNTSRIMTQFSDLDHLPELAAFPAVGEIQDYLQRYLDTFDLRKCLRLNCWVERIQPDQSGTWSVIYRTAEGSTVQENFDFVLVASGRFNQPFIPDVPGLPFPDDPNTPIEIYHSHQYMGPNVFKGKRVLLVGGAISALEIASDLALKSDVKVSIAYRGQRYVMKKAAQGVPTDHINFSLYEALAAERLSSDELAAKMRDFIVAEFGSPDEFAAPKPNEDVRIAGVTKCDHFLGLVAQKRIKVHPFISRIEGNTVHFTDGSYAQFDAIIFATGYQLDMPFFRAEEAQVIGLDSQHLGLYKNTFHPDLPGLTVAGFYNQVGPYFPVLELQARWIAYVWSQKIESPGEDSMRKGLKEYLNSWKQQQKLPMHKLAMLFARASGVEPDLEQWPDIARALWFGPLSASVFRLSGPDAVTDAHQKVHAAAQAFGMITEPFFTAAEKERLQSISVRIATQATTKSIIRDAV